MVSGSKGGVGKSIVSMSLIHYLSKRDEKLLLIDADTANPDVGKAYGKTVETVYINLDGKDGWMDLVGRQHPRSQWRGRKTLWGLAHGVHARTGSQVGNALGNQLTAG
jgi:Mrp family chromosome partitioning ATPase